MKEDLLSIASDIVAKARALGADEADAYLRSQLKRLLRVVPAEDAVARSDSIRSPGQCRDRGPPAGWQQPPPGEPSWRGGRGGGGEDPAARHTPCSPS